MKRSLTLGLALSTVGAVQAADLPPPVQALVKQGVKIEATFETPAGLTGYATRIQGRPLAFYLTPDGKHLIVGNMLDVNGRDLTGEQLAQHLPEPNYEAAWAELAEAAWVREGAADAERIVYVFTDPNCPYCNAFWRATQPYLGKDLQVRHILVGILGASSVGKAAAILGAEDPAAALAQNEKNHREGGIEPMADIPPQLQAKLDGNLRLMAELDARATPTILYKDADGKVRKTVGMPPADVLQREILQQP